MNTYEINGTYGGSQTPCTIFVYEVSGAYWYCVEDSVNVNCTIDEPIEGVDVETIDDHDTCTAQNNINSVEELERLIDGDEEPNIIEVAYESWVNGQRQQMVNQIENATFSRSEFIDLLDEVGCGDTEKLQIAIYLLNN